MLFFPLFYLISMKQVLTMSNQPRGADVWIIRYSNYYRNYLYSLYPFKMTLMFNPWTNLPKSEPYLLDSDKKQIFEFNKKVTDAKYKIHYEILPEPFLGNPKAKVVLLNLNPGFDIEDLSFHQNNEYFIKKCRDNLLHKASEYPFYLLDPKLSTSPGHKWWSGKLKDLIEECSLKKVANDICCIEFFPYHSIKFKKNKNIIESQNYSFYLVEKAIDRNALIIIMRAKDKWTETLPKLKKYKYYSLNSCQNVKVSRKNLSETKGFDNIIELLT